MEVIGDKIIRIYQTSGLEHGGAVVNTHAILLESGRCIELGEKAILPSNQQDLLPDPTFDFCIGATIIGVESCGHWPTCGLRLNDGSALVMGSPSPYYWGLCHESAVPGS
jgi:hypothetical protein